MVNAINESVTGMMLMAAGGLPTVSRMADSREVNSNNNMVNHSSVASDLTEKIRECLKSQNNSFEENVNIVGETTSVTETHEKTNN